MTPRATISVASSLEAAEQTPTAKTPRVSRCSSPPPPGPGVRRRVVCDEVQSALGDGSMEGLVLALHQEARCTHDPVFLAVQRQHAGAVEFLVRHGAGADRHTNSIRPLHLAVDMCASETDAGYRIVKSLLEHGARPDPVQGDGDSVEPPLLNAARRGVAPAVQLLCAFGANPGTVDRRGHTALHRAVSESSFWFPRGLLIALMDQGTNPFQKDHSGFSPDRYARDAWFRDQFICCRRRWVRNRIIAALACKRSELTSVEPARVCLSTDEIVGAIVSFL